ncbi:MAG: BspA family leucine-rich repeat surface protein [Bacilli bacterium]|nr:BspA family leucine-rich repeat surface protein [Bacilli bacterium]
MRNMFTACSSLESLDLSSFETNQLTTALRMFMNCNKLTSLDIRNMDFDNKTIDTTYMFQSVPSGVNIYVLNEYNKTFIEGLKSNANVIIYVPPEEELEEG